MASAAETEKQYALFEPVRIELQELVESEETQEIFGVDLHLIPHNLHERYGLYQNQNSHALSGLSGITIASGRDNEKLVFDTKDCRLVWIRDSNGYEENVTPKKPLELITSCPFDFGNYDIGSLPELFRNKLNEVKLAKEAELLRRKQISLILTTAVESEVIKGIGPDRLTSINYQYLKNNTWLSRGDLGKCLYNGRRVDLELDQELYLTKENRVLLLTHDSPDKPPYCQSLDDLIGVLGSEYDSEFWHNSILDYNTSAESFTTSVISSLAK